VAAAVAVAVAVALAVAVAGAVLLLHVTNDAQHCYSRKLP